MTTALFSTAPATPADLHTLAKIEAEAFTGPLGELLFGQTSDNGLQRRAEQLLEQMDTVPTIRIQKATCNQTGQIVGFGLWYFYREPRPLERWREEDLKGEFGNVELARDFIGTMARKRDQYVNGKAYAFLKILVCLPKFHGRGVGSALLRQGLKEADEAGLPAYLESSPRGYRVYRKFGFEDVDEFSIDLGKYGGEGSHKTVCMLRPFVAKLV